jgi:hypothetical protein
VNPVFPDEVLLTRHEGVAFLYTLGSKIVINWDVYCIKPSEAQAIEYPCFNVKHVLGSKNLRSFTNKKHKIT